MLHNDSFPGDIGKQNAGEVPRIERSPPRRSSQKKFVERGEDLGMVPISSRREIILIVAFVSITAVMVTGSVNALPLFSDYTGPSRLTVTDIDQLETGCEEEVATYTRTTSGNGSYTKTAFIETGTESANLSAWTERTSPRGADLSTFRVHIESHGVMEQNPPCKIGVQYRIRLSTNGGSPGGVLPDAHGTRILWIENGRYSGCTASVTSPLKAECHRFIGEDSPAKTWANATTEA